MTKKAAKEPQSANDSNLELLEGANDSTDPRNLDTESGDDRPAAMMNPGAYPDENFAWGMPATRVEYDDPTKFPTSKLPKKVKG